MSQLIAQLYVWSGALAFVCSLLYFVHFFGTLTPAPPMTPPLPALLTDVALFSLFAVHHSIMARSGAKRWIESQRVWFAFSVFGGKNSNDTRTSRGSGAATAS